MSAALIAAARAALDALEHSGRDDFWRDRDAAIEALRAALAAAPAPDAWAVKPPTTDVVIEHVPLKMTQATAAPIAQPDAETVIHGLHSITNEDDGVLTLRFMDEASAEAFMSSHRGDFDEALSMRQDAAPIAQPQDSSVNDLVAALADLDECYCEAGQQLSRERRNHHRQVLMKARRLIVAAGIGAQEQP